MPLPKLPKSGKIQKDEIIKRYATTGWTKDELRIKWVDVDQNSGQVRLTEYNFIPAILPCTVRKCAQYQLTFLEFRESGVFWTCGVCRRTQGPIAFENGNVVSRKAISEAEAWEIINQTGQIIPIGLEPISGTDGLQII